MPITNYVYLYRYFNEDGSISVGPIKRNETDEPYKYRIIADEGYELYFDGFNQHATVMDVFSLEGWTQFEIQEEENDDLE